MYLEYHKLLKDYKEASRKFYKALEDGSKLISSVTPGASQAKEVVVHINNNSTDDKLINYADKRSYVDDLINQTRNDMNMLDYELKKMERQLKDSPDVKDRIYYYKWIKRLSPYKFYRQLGYTVRQIYRYIGEIKENLYPKSENVTKCHN